MEFDWMKTIPNEVICNFFYAFFVIYAILFALSLIATLGIFGFMKKVGPAAVGMGIQGILTTAIAGTGFLFYYLICDRALLKAESKA